MRVGRLIHLYLVVLLPMLLACTTSADQPIAEVPTSPPTNQPIPNTAVPPTPIIAPTPAPSPISEATSRLSPQPLTPNPQPLTPAFSYPIARDLQTPGDGFFVRHGFQTENTWFNPDDWHTGEDWYAINGDAVGAEVIAVAAGQVVYVGSNYPGRVVIVRHADDLFSMYGHLDPAVAVQPDQQVQRGDLLGRVLRRDDDVPHHLHFEIRAFLFNDEVNGSQPRYGYRCGVQCAPGPGYWPIAAPDLPVALGWFNPTHAIAHRAFDQTVVDGSDPIGAVIVAADPISANITVYREVSEDGTPREAIDQISLEPGTRYPLLEQRVGPEAPQQTGAQAYQVWYRIGLGEGQTGWIAALAASDFETGSDGSPATVRFNLLPVIP